MSWKCLALLPLLVAVCAAATTVNDNNSLWQEEALDELRAECAKGSEVACMKLKVVEVMENVLKKDSYKVSDSVSVVRNGAEATEARGESGWLERAVEYVRTHDVLVDTLGSKVTLSPRNIEHGQLDVKLQFDEEDDTTEQGRSKLKKKIKKSKLKKIIVPVAIFLLLKAMTVIPLVLGILGVKAWNALQLSFGSFVVSLALAVFHLCNKLAKDAHPPAPQIVTAHGGWAPAASGWDGSAARDLQTAYRAYRRR
ncbi:uncharacterized protein [Anabrus simplex]|uniref:uncharacterized protein n=1 Tax=Anabrus simplex TaxID=316456 RepID=UPI0035A27358